MYSSFTPTCFGKGVVGALEATQVMSVLWAYADYEYTVGYIPRQLATMDGS
jgi:hypothetical protein